MRAPHLGRIFKCLSAQVKVNTVTSGLLQAKSAYDIATHQLMSYNLLYLGSQSHVQVGLQVFDCNCITAVGELTFKATCSKGRNAPSELPTETWEIPCP